MTAEVIDHPARWPALFIAGTLLILVFGEALLVTELAWLILIRLALFAAWLVLSLTAINLALRSRRGSPRRAMSYAILPSAALFAILWPSIAVHAPTVLGDRLHFALQRPTYEIKALALPHLGEPRLMVINWVGNPFRGTGVVYDESDEVTLPRGQHSASWKARIDRTVLACPYDYTVNAVLEGHFYLVDFGC
ncbi:hypothetical protein [Nitrospirillum sp. BR 11828]|uniref:hypothetical protein n=1 Tax=Nitrospirillum sp. BR 11828 TaxID=3104325 RepID=UPI002ACAD15A|nr:hypothetical protein [Nitrospirillum sp. BR 11828]MDZ5650489.1 hypothetical protein [Nitrospirillum sp. BR 11828]